MFDTGGVVLRPLLKSDVTFLIRKKSLKVNAVCHRWLTAHIISQYVLTFKMSPSYQKPKPGPLNTLCPPPPHNAVLSSCSLSFTTRWTPFWRPWRARFSGCGSLPPWRRRWRRSGSSWPITEPRGWSWTNCCRVSPPSAPAERSSSGELPTTILLPRVSDCPRV